MASSDLVSASSDLSLQHLLPTAVVSVSRPHQPLAAHATAILLSPATPLLPSALAAPSSRATVPSSASSSLIAVAPLLQPPLPQLAYRQTSSLPAAHAVAQQLQPTLLLTSSSSTVIAASPSGFPRLSSSNNTATTRNQQHYSYLSAAASTILQHHHSHPSHHHIVATAINLKIAVALSHPLTTTAAVNLKIAATISNQSI
ncbi:hypothetical protein BHE74_00042853 [Ensete ventricosum]|nr:hypothetical protein BHE74_00042853 [Ensete ventricosum]